MMPGRGWPSCAPRGHRGGQRCPLRRPIVGVRTVPTSVASATRAGRARGGRVGGAPCSRTGRSRGHRRLWNRQEIRRLPGALCWKGTHPHRCWPCPRGPLPVPGIRGLSQHSQRPGVGMSQPPENGFFSLWTRRGSWIKSEVPERGSRAEGHPEKAGRGSGGQGQDLHRVVTTAAPRSPTQPGPRPGDTDSAKEPPESGPLPQSPLPLSRCLKKKTLVFFCM